MSAGGGGCAGGGGGAPQSRLGFGRFLATSHRGGWGDATGSGRVGWGGHVTPNFKIKTECL
jgi:hypothetical protein